ncbi:hypothetical protein PAECIP111891_06389 [Paenibacillus allorhizoplanae]|uniref:Uncharacterized protein n=1 Tax=Paenibacillus allorhizoplanae TaxID=2905648 RepID=A0ABN8H9G5_9BACL|nr:hypothetical protein PAECIP111891_06389 [Paenibacillus allorhizoplanae]
MLLSAIKDTINLNEMTVVHFNKAYILVQILIVYLDGYVRIDMILKMIIFCKLFSMKIHLSFITYSFYGMDNIR